MRVSRRALGELLLVPLASIHVAKAEVVMFGSFSHPPPLVPQQQDDGPIQGHIDSARHACAVDVALHCNAGPSSHADDFVDQFFGSSDPFMNLFGGGPMMMMPGLTMTMEREENNDPFGRRIEQKSNVMRQNQEANNDPIGTLLDEMMDTAIRMHSDPMAAAHPPTIVVEGSWSSSSPSALDDMDMLFDSMLHGLFERVASASNSASADAAEEKEEEAPRREEEETSEGSAQPFSMSGWDPKLFSKRVVEHGKAVLEQAKGTTNEEEGAAASEEQEPELRNRLARRLTEVTDQVFFPLEDGSILVVSAPSQTTEEEREAEEQARLPSLGFGCGGDRCLWTLHDTADPFGRPILSGGCRDALGNVKHSLRRLRQPMDQQPQHHNLMTWTQLEQEQQLEENVNQARRERLESILTFEVAVVMLTLSALLLLRLVLFIHRRNSHGHRGGGRFGRMSSDKRRLKRRIMQAVYSNPTLKAQVEDAVGEELGNLPPLAPRALRFVGSSSSGRSERGGCFSCFHVLCHSLPLFSLMGLLCITSVTNPDAVILIGGPALVLLGLYKCCVCFFCAKEDDYSNNDVECKCCCCGTSTSDVTPDTVNKCTCNCCHGTGVCSPSCKSCCGGGDDDDAIVTSANTNEEEDGNCCKCCCCGTSASDVATGGMVGDCNCQCCHGSGVCSTDCASCGGRNGGYVSVSSSGNVGPAPMAGYPGARRSVNNKAAYVGVPVQVV